MNATQSAIHIAAICILNEAEEITRYSWEMLTDAGAQAYYQRQWRKHNAAIENAVQLLYNLAIALWNFCQQHQPQPKALPAAINYFPEVEFQPEQTPDWWEESVAQPEPLELPTTLEFKPVLLLTPAKEQPKRDQIATKQTKKQTTKQTATAPKQRKRTKKAA